MKRGKNKIKYDAILVSYFNNDKQKVREQVKKLSETELELFWTYANSRLISREDGINLANIIF